MAFAYYSPAPVAHGLCGSADSTNFPVLLLITDARFKSVGNGGHVQSASGFDIRPYADSALTSALTFELVWYNASTGAFEMHVKVPTLSHTVDTPIYIGYGDASLSSDGSSTSTWNSNFIAVYHFGSSTALSANDSTANANHGVTTGHAPTATAGLIGGAAAFNGTSQYIAVANSASLQIAGFGSVTMSAIVNCTNGSTGTYKEVFAKRDVSGSSPLDYGINFATGSFQVFTSGPSGVQSFNTNLSAGVTKQVHGVISGSATALYFDGSLIGSAGSGGGVGSSTSPMSIGSQPFPLEFLDGWLDETRIRTAITTSEITAEYNNQSAPGSFAVLGTEVPVGGGGTTVTMTQANWNWGGRAPTVNAKRMMTLSQASWLWTGVAATINRKTMMTLAQGVWNWAGRAVSINFGSSLTLARGTWNWAGRTATVNAKAMLTLGAASWVWTGRTATILSAGSVLLTSAAWVWTGRAVTINAKTAITLGQGAWRWTGRAATGFGTSTRRYIQNQWNKLSIRLGLS